MGDGFCRSKDPTNSIKVLKEKRYKGKPRKSKKHKIHIYIQNSTIDSDNDNDGYFTLVTSNGRIDKYRTVITY